MNWRSAFRKFGVPLLIAFFAFSVGVYTARKNDDSRVIVSRGNSVSQVTSSIKPGNLSPSLEGTQAKRTGLPVSGDGTNEYLENARSQIEEALSLGKRLTGDGLSSGITEMIELTRDLPPGARELAWNNFVVEAFSELNSNEILAGVLSIGENSKSNLKDMNFLDGTDAWEFLVSRTVLNFSNRGMRDELIQLSAASFEKSENNKRATAEIVAHMFTSENVAELQTLNHLDNQFEIAIQKQLLRRMTRYNRKNGLNFLVSDEISFNATQEQVDAVMNEDWFAANAFELVTRIDEAKPSRNRDLVIAKMIEIIRDDNPEVVDAWIGEISDPEIRRATTEALFEDTAK